MQKCVSVLLFVFLIGCGKNNIKNNIFDMPIGHVDVYVSAIDGLMGDTGQRPEPLFVVMVSVIGFPGPTSSYGHHETSYLQRPDYAGEPLYRDGDTLRIHITASFINDGKSADPQLLHYETIFLGFCLPGTYTLRVNDLSKTFRVPLQASQ